MAHENPAIPLLHRKNISDAQPALQNSLQRLEKITGVKYTFEVDYVELATLENSTYRGSSAIGDALKQYLDTLVNRCEYYFKKDEMYKEAFILQTSSGVISFVVDPLVKEYSELEFKDDKLFIKVRANTFYVNVSDCGMDLVSKL